MLHEDSFDHNLLAFNTDCILKLLYMIVFMLSDIAFSSDNMQFITSPDMLASNTKM